MVVLPAVLVEEAGTAGAGAGAGVAGGVGGTAGKVLVWVWFCVDVAVLCVCEVEVFKPELVGRETGVEEGGDGGSATDVLLGVASGGVWLPGWVGRMASSGACRSCFGLPEFHQSLQHSEP